MEKVKMTSMMLDNPLKSSQLHRWSRNSLCLWILNVHYHIHKPLSLILNSNQIKILLNIIISAMLTSLNWHLPWGFLTTLCMHLTSRCHQ